MCRERERDPLISNVHEHMHTPMWNMLALPPIHTARLAEARACRTLARSKAARRSCACEDQQCLQSPIEVVPTVSSQFSSLRLAEVKIEGLRVQDPLLSFTSKCPLQVQIFFFQMNF